MFDEIFGKNGKESIIKEMASQLTSDTVAIAGLKYLIERDGLEKTVELINCAYSATLGSKDATYESEIKKMAILTKYDMLGNALKAFQKHKESKNA
jgi:hypothetical protein